MRVWRLGEEQVAVTAPIDFADADHARFADGT
jgi:hypothetical protein